MGEKVGDIPQKSQNHGQRIDTQDIDYYTY